MPERPVVTLVTGADWLDGAGERAPLTEALTRRGLPSRWEVWDDPAVDWSATPLVMIRTTWDYPTRIEEFLAWARHVESVARLVNPVSILTWNTHKGYLVELARAGVECVPTWVGRPGDPVDPVIVRGDRVIVKPAVGAGGMGLAIRPADAIWGGFPAGVDHVVQPLLTSVWVEGERSVFVIDGRPVGAVAKRPAEGEIRVHEEYGGDFRAVALPPYLAAAAVDAVAAAVRLRGVDLPYARVDFLRADDRWLVSEVELVEPGLYPDTVPEVVDAYAASVAGLVRRIGSVGVG
jgi:glutathione synthase/RimK-type ligase-like ATP-grasp enzyme